MYLLMLKAVESSERREHGRKGADGALQCPIRNPGAQQQRRLRIRAGQGVGQGKELEVHQQRRTHEAIVQELLLLSASFQEKAEAH